jgi:ligand-binding sensor domain-containing protein
MRYFFLAGFFALYSFALEARDTVLIDEIKISLPVISILNDADGNIFIHTKKIIYQFKNNQLKFFKNCGSEDREMVIKNGEPAFLNRSDPNFEAEMQVYLHKLNLNERWRKFIPYLVRKERIFVAEDKNHDFFISSGENLFKIQLIDNYTILHKDKSIRGIDTLHNKLLVNTYSGIFLDTMRIWPDLLYAHGNYLQLPDHKGLLAGNIIVLTDHYKILKKIKFPNALIGNISFSKIINFENKIWIGSDKGLLQVINDTAKLVGLPLLIHNLEVVDKKLIASTHQGIYFRENEEWKKLTGFPELSYNGFKKINGLYYGLSNEGLYVAKAFYRLADLKWNKIIDCYELQKDIQNNLWLSTSNGIFRFSNVSESYDYLFKNVEFNKRSSFKLNQFIYFGSVNGLYKINTTRYKPILNDLKREITLTLNYSFIIALFFLLFLLGRDYLRV